LESVAFRGLRIILAKLLGCRVQACRTLGEVAPALVRLMLSTFSRIYVEYAEILTDEDLSRDRPGQET
jgi:hypothetical protein